MSTVTSRLNQIEKKLGEPGTRREYGLHQILTRIRLEKTGATQEEIEQEVGPPDRIVKPGEQSLAEVLESMMDRRVNRTT